MIWDKKKLHYSALSIIRQNEIYIVTMLGKMNLGTLKWCPKTTLKKTTIFCMHHTCWLDATKMWYGY